MFSLLSALDTTFNERNFIPLGGISPPAKSLFDGRKPQDRVHHRPPRVPFLILF